MTQARRGSSQCSDPCPWRPLTCPPESEVPDTSTRPSTRRNLRRQQHTMASPPPVEDQARLLEDALGVVRQQTMLMKRCLETPGKLMDALKCR